MGMDRRRSYTRSINKLMYVSGCKNGPGAPCQLIRACDDVSGAGALGAGPPATARVRSSSKVSGASAGLVNRDVGDRITACIDLQGSMRLQEQVMIKRIGADLGNPRLHFWRG